MSPTPNWRDRFIGLAAELCLARGEEPVSRHGSPEAPMQLHVEIDKVNVDVLHRNANDDRFELRCRFGRVPDQQEEQVLRQALEINLHLGRMQAGIFGLDVQRNELVLSMQQSLHQASGESLSSSLADIVAMVAAWRHIHQQAVV